MKLIKLQFLKLVSIQCELNGQISILKRFALSSNSEIRRI